MVNIRNDFLNCLLSRLLGDIAQKTREQAIGKALKSGCYQFRKKSYIKEEQKQNQELPFCNFNSPTMLSFFTLWAKVKALADEKLQAGSYFLILTSL
jgi:hypothetical protein